MNYGELFIKADTWIKSNCWLAVFDILGFSNLAAVDKDDRQAFSVRVDYEETIQHLEDIRKNCSSDCFDYCGFSDTFLLHTPDDSARSYTIIQSASKRFIKKCILSRIPARGAIAVGSLMRTKDNRAFIGNTFLEAYKYAEDQDWIGLLITPNASLKAESYGLCPTRHDFVRSDDIPMRKFTGQNILAYRFQNGAANHSSPLLPMLRDMKLHSDEKYRYIYERTEQFIDKNYQWC
jgi:hypothetical protein